MAEPGKKVAVGFSISVILHILILGELGNVLGGAAGAAARHDDRLRAGRPGAG